MLELLRDTSRIFMNLVFIVFFLSFSVAKDDNSISTVLSEVREARAPPTGYLNNFNSSVHWVRSKRLSSNHLHFVNDLLVAHSTACSTDRNIIDCTRLISKCQSKCDSSIFSLEFLREFVVLFIRDALAS